MKSLERQLQINLAVILALVMGLIWLVGSQFPHDHVPSPDAPLRFKWLFPFLAAAGIGLVLLIQRMVIRHTFRHLDKVHHELRKLETGGIQKLTEEVPSELYPIVREFNYLLNLMHERLERSRNSLGNLAHALKGPLNLLVQHLDEPETEDCTQQAKLQAERIRQLTERELKRARVAGQGNTTERFDPHKELPVLVDVLSRIHHKNPRCIMLNIAPEITRFGDREDMLELIGNLLDNACKWATEHVYCQISRYAGQVRIIVEDDGPGRTDEELQQMAERGVRLDESVEGHGLGLSICKDIVKLYGGTIAFERSDHLGGVKVVIVL